MFMKHYAPNRCEPSIEALNIGGGGHGLGDQGTIKHRSEVFVKIQKKNGGGGVRKGGQGGCERRIEVFVKIQKKKYFFSGGGGDRVGSWGWSSWEGGGVRVDVNREVKFLKIQKKIVMGVLRWANKPPSSLLPSFARR